MSTAPPPPPNGPFLGGYSFPSPLHRHVYYTKCHIFKNEEVLWVLLKISLIFKKFYNIMKYLIKIILIGVSGLNKIFLTQVVLL